MSGAIAFLQTKGAGPMNRRLFPTEQEARDWAVTQPIPPWAFGWVIQVFGDDGCVMSSQSVKWEGRENP